MNKRRLLKLARLLDRVPPWKFNMGEWGVASGPVTFEPRCASQACALGWATVIPEFGLELVAPDGCRLAKVRCIDNHRIHGIDAARRVFGVNYTQASRLFINGWGASPKAKAAEIRAMVAHG